MTCEHHTARVRCPDVAVAALTDPDGIAFVYVCWQHGAAILGEYAVKLGEQWGASAIQENRP